MLDYYHKYMTHIIKRQQLFVNKILDNNYIIMELLEIFGGVIRQRTISGSQNRVGRVLRVVLHLEHRSGC